MSQEKIMPGFLRPQVPQDEWTARQYEKYGLGATPSLEEIEATATELLSSPLTSIAGAELVLGRWVNGNLEKEPEVLPIIAGRGLSGVDRFGLLLMQRGVEEAKAQQAKGQG